MNNHRFSNTNVDVTRASEPKKLHKPRRALGDLRPEQVIPYVDETPCDTGDMSGDNGSY